MTDYRLLSWYIAILVFNILFPFIRKIMNPKNSKFTPRVFKSMFFIIVTSSINLYLYLEELIEAPEFQFLQILVVLIYYYSGFDYTIYSWKSKETKVQSFNKDVLQRIGRSFGGSKTEESDSGYNFVATTPYRLKYQIDTMLNVEGKTGFFRLTSFGSNLQIIKIINILSIYLIIQSLTSEQEEVIFPILGSEVNAVLSVLFAISITLIILYLEIDSGNSFSDTLPVMYNKILQKIALSKLQGGRTFQQPDIKGKAQSILDKRNTNVLKAKKEEVQGKLSSVFGEKETTGLDKKSIERMRLMETVKRILNSTPPWAKVSLSEISTLAKGDETEVEIIIAGLRDLKEVLGIYDIWTKTYHGTSSSHWLITKVLNELPETDTSVENVKIYPDGGSEFSFKNKKEK